MNEECSCGAKISVPIPITGMDKPLEILKDWRQTHRHEFPPEAPLGAELPTIVESVSSHERAMAFGFAPAPEGGWGE